MKSTHYDPSFWNTLDTMMSSSFCIVRLEELKLKFHGKQRQILREHINNAVKVMEEIGQEG